MGSDVAGALKCGAEGPIAVADAYGLNAEWVISAAAMLHYGDGNATGASRRSGGDLRSLASDTAAASSASRCIPPGADVGAQFDTRPEGRTASTPAGAP